MALGNVIIKDVDGNLPYAASASNEKITGLLFDVSGQPDLYRRLREKQRDERGTGRCHLHHQP